VVAEARIITNEAVYLTVPFTPTPAEPLPVVLLCFFFILALSEAFTLAPALTPPTLALAPVFE
jgi:hypothetical protein